MLPDGFMARGEARIKFMKAFSFDQIRGLMKFLIGSTNLSDTEKTQARVTSLSKNKGVTDSFSLPAVMRHFGISFTSPAGFRIFKNGVLVSNADFDQLVSSVKSLLETGQASPIEEPKEKPQNIGNDIIVAARNGKRDIVVWNALTGEVVISNHAWRRFLERFCKMTRREAKVRGFCEDELVKLQSSFTKAKKTTLSEKVVFGRLLNNGVKPATYLYNQKDNLRFIVVEQDNTKLLVTVEDPYHRRKKVEEEEAPTECDLPDYVQRYLAKKKELDT